MNDQLTTNFKRSEFACKGENCCGHSCPISPVLVTYLQLLRNRIDAPLTISSGFRCRTHNEKVGGSLDSLHTYGLAVDVMCPKGKTLQEFLETAESIPPFRDGGIGVYTNPPRLHLDLGPKRRWQGE